VATLGYRPHNCLAVAAIDPMESAPMATVAAVVATNVAAKRLIINND